MTLPTEHRQSHNGRFIICVADGQRWPCNTVAAAMSELEALSEQCQFICPDCAGFVWMQMQHGEMWCPNGGDCRYYASQFDILRLVFDPSLTAVQAEVEEYRQRFRV